MKLLLASSAGAVMGKLVRHFDNPVAGQKCAFITTASEVEKRFEIYSFAR